MSAVDDLEYAEDLIGEAASMLRAAASEIHQFHARQTIDECPREICIRLREQLPSLEGYCRPSCSLNDDGTWECGEYCGCPGTHPESHGEEP